MSRYDSDYVKIVVNQQHKEFLQEAEQSRLLKVVRPQRPGHDRILAFRTAVSWLAEWSSQLQCVVRSYLTDVVGGY